ncbi:DUF6344 domain-containing protein [Streptomyces sp. NPDC021020]|uniref:DUF6344 domain-containing protein n=1 Tax=Streptomyces sp. NPDC021020 TaxID=3365109 RepID=UPI0037BC10DF
MAATISRISAFWAAFLNLLITCIGALGFTVPARLRAAASATPAVPAAPTTPAAPAVPPVPTVAPVVPAGRTAAGPPPQAPARAALPAVPPQAAAGRGRTAAVPAQATASPEPRAGAPARRRSAPADRAAAPSGRTFVPAPRPYARERSLPPTMKQRIGAEAHGASPSARSVAEPFDLAFGPLVSAAAAGQSEARIPAARRRDRALCG